MLKGVGKEELGKRRVGKEEIQVLYNAVSEFRHYLLHCDICAQSASTEEPARDVSCEWNHAHFSMVGEGARDQRLPELVNLTFIFFPQIFSCQGCYLSWIWEGRRAIFNSS